MTDAEDAENELSVERLQAKARQHSDEAESHLDAGDADRAAHSFRHAAQYAEALASMDSEVTQR